MRLHIPIEELTEGLREQGFYQVDHTRYEHARFRNEFGQVVVIVKADGRHRVIAQGRDRDETKWMLQDLNGTEE